MEWLDLFFGLNLSTWAVFIVVILLIRWYQTRSPLKNLPPGPPSVPILGSLPFIETKNTILALSKLSVKYGDIYMLYLGSERTVVLNSYEVIKDALVKQGNAFSGRPNDFISREFAKCQGMSYY